MQHQVLNLDYLKKYSVIDFSFNNDPIPKTLDKYNRWVEKKDHLPLLYLEGERKKIRQSLHNFYPEFSQSITFLFSYSSYWQRLRDFYQSNPKSNGFKISSYVLGFQGFDYHYLIKNHLEKIAKDLKALDSELGIKLTLDVHPVLERDLAVRSGLGWFGKNSMFIHRKEGSFLLLGSLLLSKKIIKDKVPKIETDHCGQCTRCIDACPTDALNEKTRTLIASKCISTFTIEMFKETPAPKNMENAGGEIFGCDICQDVCPFNTRLIRLRPEFKDEQFFLEEKHNNSLFDFFLKRPLDLIIDDLLKMSNREFVRRFKFSSLARTGRKGLLKNLNFYKRP